MTAAAPTIVALETDSAWVVILVVSLVTLPIVLVLRKLIDRPGGVMSGLLLGLPLAVPLAAAAVFHHAVLPEIAILRPAGPALLERSQEFLQLMLVADDRVRIVMPYILSGSAGSWLLVIGLLSSSFMLLRRGAGRISLARLIRRSVPADDKALLETVARLAFIADLTRVPEVLFLPDGVPGAFATGGRKARILMSRRLLEVLDSAELEGVLAHEIAHIKARDVQLVFAAGIFRDMVAWNPIAHLAYRRLVWDRELEADRRSVAMTGRPLAVASGLLKLSAMRTRVGLTPRPALGFVRRGALSHRVRQLLAIADGRRRVASPRRTPYVIAGLVTAAVGLHAGAVLADEDRPALALVWGAPRAENATLWTRPTRAGGAIPKSAARPRSMRKAVRVRAGETPSGRPPEFSRGPLGLGIAVRERDFDRWVVAIEQWARRHGVPGGTLRELRVSWRAVPLLDDSSGLPFGVYRIESQWLEKLGRGPQK
ncbi:MAG TPA: M56 family metallopeptidase [Actinomycetota bacterium]|nr:M56 family metallopeptidase [Actinomycetota bacterium]